jgi:hypothetical protein
MHESTFFETHVSKNLWVEPEDQESPAP